MFAKIDVNGDNAAELFTIIKADQPGDDEGGSDIKWNFEKFLVNGDGQAIARWGTRVTPEEIREQLPALM